MGTGALEKSGAVKLNTLGNGSVQLQVPSGETWTIVTITITTISQVPPPAKCIIFRGTSPVGAAVIASSSTGNNDVARGNVTLLAGEIVEAKWEGGIPQDTARMTIAGTVEGIGYR